MHPLFTVSFYYCLLIMYSVLRVDSEIRSNENETGEQKQSSQQSRVCKIIGEDGYLVLIKLLALMGRG